MVKVLKFIGIFFLIIILAAAAFVGDIFYENSHVRTTEYTVTSSKITAAEDGGKIAVIADFHNSDNYERIIEQTKKAAPDAIVIAGDFISMTDTDFTNADACMKGLVEVAPVYFVSGNHERWLKTGEDAFLSRMEALGANILNMKIAEVPVKDGKITITGYQDLVYADSDIRVEYMNAQLEGMYDRLTDEQKSMFNMLVFHRGQLLHYAARQPYDLIVAGHLHGGQVNIPKIREAIIREKTGSDEFVRGEYDVDGVKTIISGGLENNNNIPRVFNMPEVVIVNLKAAG